MQNSNHPTSNLPDSGEVSLFGIYSFLKQSWKLMLFSGLIGLACALIFLFVFSARFETFGLIKMAHFVDNEVYPHLVTSVEEPGQLIDRFKSGNLEILECDLQGNKKNSYQIVGGGGKNSVEFSVRGDDAKFVLACSNAISNWIMVSQKLIADSKIRIAKIRLKLVNERIAQLQYFLSKPVLPRLFSSDSFSNLLTQKQDLEDEAEKLRALIFNYKFVNAMPLTPFQVRNSPSFLKCTQVILAGLSGGVFVGLFFSLMIMMFRQLKKEFSLLLKLRNSI